MSGQRLGIETMAPALGVEHDGEGNRFLVLPAGPGGQPRRLFRLSSAAAHGFALALHQQITRAVEWFPVEMVAEE